MNKFFKLEENKTNITREGLAGLTSFLAMSYILIVNPSMLAQTGMDEGAVFTATILSAVVGSLIMGLYANYPIGQAPGMGMNAFFTYTVVLSLGYSWQQALFAIFISGIIFVIISFSGLRQKIISAIPSSLKFATSAGIGFFIAFIGLQNSGIITNSDSTLVTLGDFSSPALLLTLLGLVVMLYFTAKNNNFAIIIGIALTFVVALVINMFGIDSGQHLPEKIISMPPAITPVFAQFFDADMFSILLDFKFLIVIFTFLFMDFFDTTGTLLAVGSEANLIDKEGNLKNGNKALVSDGIATVTGSILGTSSVTSFVESLSGVKSGGRTGLTAVVISLLFLLSLFFAPIFTSVASFVTAPALIMVGILMATNIGKIDFKDLSQSSSTFMTIIMMVLGYSIATGIAFGFITYTLIKVFQGKAQEVSYILYGLCIVFILYFLSTTF